MIYSSPFLRTLETACAIAHELSVTEIRVTYRAFEWQSKEIYPEGTPIRDELLVSQLETDSEGMREFTAESVGHPGIRIVHDKESLDEVAGQYPEDRGALTTRLNKLYADLRD